jgi:hypothetical protein
MPALVAGMGLLTLIWRVLADPQLVAEVLFLQQHFCPFPFAFSPPAGFV